MPGKVKVRIIAGRNLPVMDKSSDTSDAFVEVKLGNTTYKTEVYRHSLNPCWNSDCFRFEVDDEELQDEPLQIRIMDYDTYSANDAIGKVYIDLNPLLFKGEKNAMWGWFPIYDTMHGIRGEVHCAVKVDLFSDSNRFRQSSCGVRFFYSPGIPYGYACQAILGFVEELVVNDDPEYQWIDKIRTPRASNEARQTLFSKLSGEVKRKIGLKALELGGNSVVGYQQYFDLEGESGIVVRGIGTAVVLTRLENPSRQHSRSYTQKTSQVTYCTPLQTSKHPGTSEDFPSSSYDACINQRQLSSSATSTTSTAMGSASNIQRQTNGQSVSPRVNTVLGTSPGVMANIGSSRHGSSDPDLRGISNQKANSNHSSLCGSVGKSFYKFMISPESFHLLEYPFITMKQFAPGFVAHIGGTVSSRSVKLLDHINCPDDPESRDTWWMELRKEIRCHCRSLACNAVLGYSEATYICDNVVILSASGTAVVVATGSNSNATHSTGSKGGGDTIESGKAQSRTDVPTKTSQQTTANSSPIDQQTSSSSTYLPPSCAICHIPYPESSVPFHSSLLNCNLCKKAKVLDVIFMTIEPPPNIPIVGKGCLIQARVCRNKRDSKGEQCAKEISDSLPFLEHELHRQLLSKVKVKGMNAIFGLTVQISFGENMLIALATGTAAYVAALPPPKPPRVSSGKGVNTTDLNAIQKLILESISRYREHYGLSHIPLQPENDANESERNNASKTVIDNSQEYSDNGAKNGDDGSSDILSSKDGCVILEVDDTEDADIISLMIDSDVPKGYEICNTETMPGLVNQFTGVLQTFAHVHRVKLMAVKQFGQQFDWIIQELFVKLRRLIPCCLADLKFRVDLPEQDLVQVTVLGTAVGLSGICYPIPPGSSDVRSNRLLPVAVRRRRALSANDSCDDLLFNMDDENSFNDECDTTLRRSGGSGSGNELANQSNFIELTPLSYIPGAHIQKYLGNLDFFFIRETTSVRENGGLNGFILSFLSEVYAIVRAHVASLSGNAMVSLHLNQCVLMNNPHKNQAQCLINVAGDVVCIQSCSQKFVN
ncbi:C2 domain-containing protein 5 isoform X3 [Brevipalpus obovatus]|uniref:C2 domain-containing protein 5 isoform X3 n=1 Tax=Brevipalpus obovatus TaxID=246614 RepID=UPI003D9F922E